MKCPSNEYMRMTSDVGMIFKYLLSRAYQYER